MTKLTSMRSGVLALAIAAGIMSVAAHADVKAGVDAWSAGDYDGAIRQWQPLADKGDADAEFNLAQAYKLGRGVPMDLVKAESLYGQAAAKGHLQAADAYGLLLFQRGQRKQALPYIEASAERGDARAQYILGIAHFNGDIVKKDWVRAYALISLAQQSGLGQASHAKAQMDEHIPIADRQKSVILAEQIAARAQANRQQLNASAELATQTIPITPASSATLAGADYARPSPPRHVVAAKPTAEVTPAKPSPPTHASAATEKTKAPAPISPRKPEQKKSATIRPQDSAETGPWRVQLGAFGVASNADALWAKVKGRPELAGRRKTLAPAGKLTKLQASGFPSKSAADAACQRLAASGFGCLAVED